MADHQGKLPSDPEKLIALPGVGNTRPAQWRLLHSTGQWYYGHQYQAGFINEFSMITRASG